MSDANNSAPTTHVPGQIPESDFLGNVPIQLVLTILTCGLFNFYWNYRQMQACNQMLVRKEFQFGIWLLLTILTCGIYHLFYQYKMGMALVELQRIRQQPVFENLPVLSLLVSIFGLSIGIDAIHQLEINKLVDPMFK